MKTENIPDAELTPSAYVDKAWECLFSRKLVKYRGVSITPEAILRTPKGMLLRDHAANIMEEIDKLQRRVWDA